MMDIFDQELAQASEQGSPIWKDIRAGRFTSSEIYRLMGAGKREMTDQELKARPKTGVGSKSKYIEDVSILPDGFMTYVEEKVAEVLTGISKQDIFSHATAWGDEWEPVADEFFQKRTGLVTIPCSFVPFGDHAGGTSDRYIGDTELVEYKCPHNSTNQVKYMMLTDQWDLKRMYPEYYYQIQSNLLWTSRELGHFAAFDPRMKDDRHKLVHIKVKRIDEDIDLITKKVALAVKEKLSLLNLL
jgi:YqaJ-like viral recombinase domain